VIERILRHLGLWQQGVSVVPGTDPPADWVIEPCFDLSAGEYPVSHKDAVTTEGKS
jgi:hypothetical protein